MNMAEHRATIAWQRTSDDFSYEGYTRDHTWTFEGGETVPASAAPQFRGNPKLVDPESAFVAALSSCHLLTFLAIASKKRFVVDEYTDDAVGHLEKNAEGKFAVTRVRLRPLVKFGGERQPTAEQLDAMHHDAHAACFIANSVRTEVIVEPREK